MQHLSGIVTVVQEGRFRLSTGDGRSLLFSLAHQASLEPQDLEELCARAALVEVSYAPSEGVNSLTAYAINEIGDT